jgi:hypothetical protein
MEIRRLNATVATPKPTNVAAQNNSAAPAVTRDTFVAPTPSPTRGTPSAPSAPATFALPTQGQWTSDLKTGARSDPATIYVHGSLGDIETSLQNAGWTKADPQGLGASVRYVGAALKQEAYKAISWFGKHVDGIELGLAGAIGMHPKPLLPQTAPYVEGVDKMPVSAQTLNGQKLVAAFEENNDPLGGRHHLRIFDTGQKDAQGKPVFAIAASRDTGIRFAPDHPETGFMFHTVEPDVDAERDRVIGALAKGGEVSGLTKTQVPFGPASKIGEFVGDSSLYELNLSTQHPTVENWV